MDRHGSRIYCFGIGRWGNEFLLMLIPVEYAGGWGRRRVDYTPFMEIEKAWELFTFV